MWVRFWGAGQALDTFPDISSSYEETQDTFFHLLELFKIIRADHIKRKITESLETFITNPDNDLLISSFSEPGAIDFIQPAREASEKKELQQFLEKRFKMYIGDKRIR